MALATFNSLYLYSSKQRNSNSNSLKPSSLPNSQLHFKQNSPYSISPPPRLTISALRHSRAAEVTKDSWERSILKSDLPVLVEFYASWCGPCKMVHRMIDEIAAEYAGKINCFVVDTDNGLQVADEYDIKAVPVVLLFKNGVKCESVAGTMPKDFYIAAIDRALKL